MAQNKEYIHPAQQRQETYEKKRQKKRKKKRFLFTLFIILAIVILLLIMKHLGIGFGGGKGQGGSASGDDSVSVSADESSRQDESSQLEKTVVQVKISGSTYIYGDRVYTIEDFRDEIASVMDKTSVIIELADDNAVANAVEDMHAMLDGLGISYTDTGYESVQSGEDSSSLAV